MSDYTRVRVIDGDGNFAEDKIENPDGDIIASYDRPVAHPKDTAKDIADDFSDDPRDMFLFIMERRWDFRTEQS